MSGTAVLLIAHGSPERVEDIPEFLQNISRGRPMPEAVVRRPAAQRAMAEPMTLAQATLSRPGPVAVGAAPAEARLGPASQQIGVVALLTSRPTPMGPQAWVPSSLAAAAVGPQPAAAASVQPAMTVALARWHISPRAHWPPRSASLRRPFALSFPCAKHRRRVRSPCASAPPLPVTASRSNRRARPPYWRQRRLADPTSRPPSRRRLDRNCCRSRFSVRAAADHSSLCSLPARKSSHSANDLQTRCGSGADHSIATAARGAMDRGSRRRRVR